VLVDRICNSSVSPYDDDDQGGGGNYALSHSYTQINIQCVPLATEPGFFFNNSNTNVDIATKFEHEHVRCVTFLTQ